MLAQRGAEAGANIAGHANFDRDLLAGQHFLEFLVTGDGQTVPDALRADIQRAPDRFGARGLASVSGQSQALVCGFLVKLLKPFGGSAALVGANADTDRVAVAPGSRQP